jgi:hypothetical protein
MAWNWNYTNDDSSLISYNTRVESVENDNDKDESRTGGSLAVRTLENFV